MRDPKQSFSIPVFAVSILLIIILGVVIRTYHLFVIGFSVPFDLGGLFYQMSLEIIKNNFVLPKAIPYYSLGGLPFAYPPIPFYLQAVIIKIFTPQPFLTVNLLPPIISMFSLFAFIPLAMKEIKSKYGVLFALLAFASLPVAFIEQIEAQGLSESIGTLSIVIYLWVLHLEKENDKLKGWLLPGLALAFCVMSSPGSLYASILISILFSLLLLSRAHAKRSFQPIVKILLIAIAGLVISSPYWLVVIHYHGINVYLEPFLTQNNGLMKSVIDKTLKFNFFSGSRVWQLLFCIGFIITLIRKNYFLFFVMLFLYLIPRESWVLSIPVSLITGYGIGYLSEKSIVLPDLHRRVVHLTGIFLILIVSIQDASGSLNSLINDETYDISSESITDLSKIKKSQLIPEDANVVVIGSWGLIEWSPCLLARNVINNHFGLEWQPVKGWKNRALTDALMRTKDPIKFTDLVHQAYPDIQSFYLIAEKQDIDQLQNGLDGKDTVQFSILQEYSELNLGFVTSQSQ